MSKVQIICSVAAACALHTASAALPPEIQKRVNAEIAAKGGIVTIMPTGNVIRVVNAQKAVPPAFLGPLVKDVQQIGIKVPIEVSDALPLVGQDPMALANSSLFVPKTGAVIVLVEVKNFPTLLVAPENAWAILNVRNLKADNPSKEVLETRITKEFWRAVASGVGGMNSQMGPCVMRPVARLSDLDRIRATRLGPDATMRVIQSLGAYGIGMISTMNYEDACYEGLAPTPTNDVQKAIWDKVHAIPQKPIKIEYNEKRDKGK